MDYKNTFKKIAKRTLGAFAASALIAGSTLADSKPKEYGLGAGVEYTVGSEKSIGSLNGYSLNEEFPDMALGILVDNKSNLGAALGLSGDNLGYSLGWQVAGAYIDETSALVGSADKTFDSKSLNAIMRASVGLGYISGSRYDSEIKGLLSVELSKTMFSDNLEGILGAMVTSDGEISGTVALNYNFGKVGKRLAPSLYMIEGFLASADQKPISKPTVVPDDKPDNNPDDTPDEIIIPYVPPVETPQPVDDWGTGNPVGQ